MLANELRNIITEDPEQVQVIYYKKTEGKEGLALDIPPECTDFKYLFEKEADKDTLLLY